MMNQACIVTEGKFDERLLKRVMPPDIAKHTEFVVGTGRYSAQSLARTILAFEHRPVALVVSTDATDPSRVQELEDFLWEALDEVSPGVDHAVFLAIPDIEIVLLSDRQIFEDIVERHFSDLEWAFAQEKPKMFLQRIMGGDYEKILDTLEPQALSAIQKHPLVNDLCEFMYSVMSERQFA